MPRTFANDVERDAVHPLHDVLHRLLGPFLLLSLVRHTLRLILPRRPVRCASAHEIAEDVAQVIGVLEEDGDEVAHVCRRKSRVHDPAMTAVVIACASTEHQSLIRALGTVERESERDVGTHRRQRGRPCRGSWRVPSGPLPAEGTRTHASRAHG